ncbi:hypothetical protein [Bosea rubneri]|uniref:Uncharacterized protein n=1 Tax=Bosea rubneri TaxID=3075434 RepID=A0ABU3SF55_9HYPH|nr:hypothetical protein [Bosea sp. ZW T0_25]MDU0343424.1 hypothetical protein [Bosea sp. ZW T0_25]
MNANFSQDLADLKSSYEHSALAVAPKPCVIAIEDTCTSFTKEFSRHRDRSFLEYAKDATDVLVSNANHFFEGEFPPIDNQEVVDELSPVYSIQFYSGTMAFKLNPSLAKRPELIWNKPLHPEVAEHDFRYDGVSEATVVWPTPNLKEVVTVRGGRG